MSERLNLISRLRTSHRARTAYIFAKLSVLVPAQVRALRFKSPQMPFQKDLARAAEMQQSRISMLETPGAANVTLETISKVAAAFKVGVVVRFVPFSEMLRWENEFSPDRFDPTRLDQDEAFLNPATATEESVARTIGSTCAVGSDDMFSGEKKPLQHLDYMGIAIPESSGMGAAFSLSPQWG